MTALEVMIDEAAASIGQDPVTFRKANRLKTSGKTMVGNVVSGSLRSGEVLDRLASKPVWAGRASEKVRRAATDPQKAYGVGLACVSTVFGRPRPRRRPPDCALVNSRPEATVQRAALQAEKNIGSIVLIVRARPASFPEMRLNKKEYRSAHKREAEP